MRFHPVANRIALFFAAVSLTPIATSHAFIFLKGSNYLKGERPVSDGPIWPSRNVSFLVNTNLSAMGGSIALPISGTELLQAVQESVNAWSAACRADIRVVLIGTTNGTYNSNDGINIIQWDNRTTAEGNFYGTSTSTLAAATTVLRNAEFGDCDIVLNGNSSTTMKFSPAAGEADLRSILTHEIGHCLGLDHPIEPPTYTSVDPFITDATMVQTAATGLDPSDPSRRDIAQDDRDGIECLYERGKPFRTGLHCGSYSGTNGQGAISGAVVGGPTVIDTGCGGDAQGRNAHPSLESGDGCIPSAVASTGIHSEKPRSHSPLEALGGTWGFLSAVVGILTFRLFRRRSLRRLVLLPLFALGISSAHAVELELSYGSGKISPDVWNAFAGMDPQASAWDRAPSTEKMSSLSEIRATAFTEYTNWGKWGGALTLTLPTSLETNAKAQGAAEQSKRTTLSGLRIGPDFRWYPTGSDHPIHWFVGGRAGLGFFYGSQTFSSTTQGEVSYRAWASELALTTGAEVPIGGIRLVAEAGYSRKHSSYFTSTGSTGAAYADFPSGTRLSTNTTGAASEDVRFDGSGFFATLGLQVTFGSNEPANPATSVPAPERTPAPAPSPVPTPSHRGVDPIPDTLESYDAEEAPPTREPDPVPQPPIN